MEDVSGSSVVFEAWFTGLDDGNIMVFLEEVVANFECRFVIYTSLLAAVALGSRMLLEQSSYSS
jgi:hypothetical protein